MYFKSDDLNYDERKLVGKISDILNWARQNNRQDIVDEVNSNGTINNLTNLRKTYYKLSQMKKSENNIQTNISKPVMQENQPPVSEQPVPQPQQPSVDPTSFDPLLGANPKQRDYTSGMPNNAAGGVSMGNIPEPNFQGQPTGGFGQLPPNQKDQRFSDTQDLPPNEKNKSSEELAKMLVDAYATNAPRLFSYMAKIKDSKVEELSRNGDIELNLVLRPNNITVGEYIDQSNKELDRAFDVTPEWKSEITPVLNRVLQKRNWGVTDEQMLAYYVGSHLIQCGVIAAQVMANNNKFLQDMANMTQAYRQSGNLPKDPIGGNNMGTPPPSAPVPPPPPPAPMNPIEPEILEPIVEEIPNEVQFSIVPVTGMDSDPIAPARYSTTRNGRTQPNNAPPVDEMEEMPNASHITTNITPLNPNQ